MFHLIIEASAIWSTFVNSLKDKQCRLIFTAAFSHIYQGFQYQWRALYIILIGQSWHSNVFCIIDSCLKQLIFYTTNSISLGTLWSLFSHIINSNPYLILLIYTYRISTMRNPNKIDIIIMCTALLNGSFWLAKIMAFKYFCIIDCFPMQATDCLHIALSWPYGLFHIIK